MIPKNKIEEFIEKETFQVPYDGTNDFYNKDKAIDIKLGVSFAEKELENLAVEFYDWMQKYQDLSSAIRINDVNNSKELFEIFKQEKYEHEH